MYYPTVGISFGLDVIYTALSQKETISSTADLFIIPLGTELQCLQIAQQLRSTTSLKVELELAGRKLKRALNYANKENISYVLIIGEDELSTNTVVLRNMKEGSEVKVPISSLKDNTLNNYFTMPTTL